MAKNDSPLVFDETGTIVIGCDESASNVIIPGRVKHISYCAFRECASLVSIMVAEDNPCFTSVDGVLFDKEKKRIVKFPAGKKAKTYSIPEGVTSIDYFAFCKCISLVTIKIPNSVTSIGPCAFCDCTSLITIEIPNSVTCISERKKRARSENTCVRQRT